MADLDECNRLLQQTKINLFISKGSGFLGALLCRLNFRWDYNCPTAYTDGLCVGWNPDFFLSLDVKTRVTVLAHEVWHVAYLHMVRRGTMDPEDWNIAADHVINLMLKHHGYYMDGFPYYMDSKYVGWSTNDIYDDIHDPNKPKIICQGGLGSDIRHGSVSDDQASVVISKVIGAITAAKMGNDPGSIPGEISMVIDHFLNPKLPWEVILYNFFNELVEQEYSFRRPNRRYDDPLLPGLVGMRGLDHLMYFLDVSGSVGDDDILRFNSEVKFIKEEFNPGLLSLITFDTKIRDEYIFEPDDPFEKIVVTGRGGTDLQEVFERIKRDRPNAAVIFTDLCVSIPPDPGVPIIWICLNQPEMIVPFGKLIHLSNDGRVKDGLTDASQFVWGHNPVNMNG